MIKKIIAYLRRIFFRDSQILQRVLPRGPCDIDTNGPFRNKPEIDVELLDDEGQSIGQSTVELIVKINSKGIVVRNVAPVDVLIQKNSYLTAWAVWVGDDRLESPVTPPRFLGAGDTFRFNNVLIPVTLNAPNIRLDPNGRGPIPPEPQPSPTSTSKQSVKE
jgi:hypothetical protein